MNILVIDNDPIFLKFIEKFLTSDGHKVVTAQDGLGALDLLDNFTPDICFVDYVMPNIDGKVFCQILRNDPKYKSTFLVILSAIAAEEWTNLKVMGADACIAKGPLNNMKGYIAEVVQNPEASRKYCAAGNIIGLQDVYPRLITKELLDSKKHFQLLLDRMSEGIFEINNEKRVVFVNPAAQGMLDLPRDAILGSAIAALFPPDQASMVEDLINGKGGRGKSGAPEVLISMGARFVNLKVVPLKSKEAHSLIILNDISDYKHAEHDLTKANDFLKSILNSAYSISIVSTDLDQNITFWNRGAEELFGYSAEEVVGKQKVTILYPGAAEEQLADEIRQLMQKDKQAVSCQLAEQTKDGRKLWMKLHLSPRIDAHGKVVGILGIGEDITQQKDAEKDLVKSEERYRQIFNIAPAGIYEVDLKSGRLLSVNDGICEYTGYSRAELLSLNALELLTPESQQKYFERIEKMAAGQAVPETAEYTALKKDGSQFVMSLNAKYTYAGSTPVEATVVVHDITARKKAEAAVLESEKRFRLLSELAEEGIVIHEKGIIVDTNEAMARIFGYSPAELVGLSIEKLVSADTWKKIIENITAAADSRFEGIGIRKEGASFHCVMAGRSYHFRGKALRVAAFRDISTRKKLENQLYQAQKMKSLGTLAGGVAHDFNNLLMGIQGRASIMKMSVDPSSSLLDHLHGIEEYIQSAAALTKQLLGFARGGKYEIRTIDLNEFIQKQSRLFGRTRKDVTIQEAFEPRLWAVEVDQGQIEQVLLNILVNAWQAMPGGGDLFIRTENCVIDPDTARGHDTTPGKFTKFAITDTGIGMDAEVVDRIFDPFFTTKEIGRGTGLGLASAYGIIYNHGGFFEVVSEKYKGSTFSVYLPATDKVVVTEKSSHESIMRGEETLLLVDDEKMILDVGQEILEILGYEVLVATNGEAALELYRAHADKIDLVILDLIMPGMDGREIYTRLKEMNPEARVLLSSGYSINGEAAEIIEMGCDGFIQKPYNMGDLSAKVREILDNSK